MRIDRAPLLIFLIPVVRRAAPASRSFAVVEQLSRNQGVSISRLRFFV
jgi:hypothetical protein